VTGLYALHLGSPASYLVALLVPALDALIPVLPTETAVIALGVATAGSADARIGLLVTLAAFGAFLGDNAAYLLGRRFGPAVDRRLLAGERGARRRAWAQESLDRFGIRIIIACRFIPGGRTAVTLTGGLIGYPRRRFVTGTAIAGIVWACYAFFLGRLGGEALLRNTTMPNPVSAAWNTWRGSRTTRPRSVRSTGCPTTASRSASSISSAATCGSSSG
jgi:membrane-associated protein